jgi:hypothetical protein
MLKMLKNEEGSALVIALFALLLLTLIGIGGNDTASTEIQIAANDKFHKLSFYAGEAGRAYVASDIALYGPNNISVGSGINFPNDADPSQTYALGPSQSFSGEVEYIGNSQPPRGSGYEAGKFKAHRYQMTVNGQGPRSAMTQIEAGFYRIGF